MRIQVGILLVLAAFAMSEEAGSRPKSWMDKVDQCARGFYSCRPSMFLLQPIDHCMSCKVDINCRGCMKDMDSCVKSVKIEMLEAGEGATEAMEYVNNFGNTVQTCISLPPVGKSTTDSGATTPSLRKAKTDSKVPQLDYNEVMARLGLENFEVNASGDVETNRLMRHRELLKETAAEAFGQAVNGRKMFDDDLFGDDDAGSAGPCSDVDDKCDDPYADDLVCLSGDDDHEDCNEGGRRQRRRLLNKFRAAAVEAAAARA